MGAYYLRNMAEYKFDFCVNTDGRLHVTQLPKTLFPITRNGHTFTLKTGVSPNQIPVYLTYKDGSLYNCQPKKHQKSHDFVARF